MPRSLRKAKRIDEALVTGIMSAAYSRPWTHRHVALALENNEVWLTDDDGFIIYELNGLECELKIIAVHPRAQKCGIGAELMQMMIETCAQKNIEKIFLEVEESNEAALKLYKRFSFSQYSKTRRLLWALPPCAAYAVAINAKTR